MQGSEPDKELSYNEWKARIDHIKDMADAMSFTNSSCTSYTSASTIRGIGSTSGKAIQFVGEAVVHLGARVAIEYRLRRALAYQGNFSREINESMIVMADILEYLRLGLYPDIIRFRAWLILLGWMAQPTFRYGGPDVMAYVLEKWTVGDVGLLINQIYICALSNWSFHLIESRKPANVPKFTARQRSKMSKGVLSIIHALRSDDRRAEVAELCASLDNWTIRRQVISSNIIMLTETSFDITLAGTPC